MPVIRFLLNGHAQTWEGDPAQPLLWTLRDDLGLTGTKYGCGEGLCGACTVHLDGAPARACLTSMQAMHGRRLTTIEALPEGPLQRAWLAERVPQCGYCQGGMLMAAAVLLRDVPRPADADIDAALRGHLCRCGSYARVRAAVKLAAQESAR